MNVLFIPHIPTMSGRRYQLSKHLVLLGHNVYFVLWSQPYPFSLSNIKDNILNSIKSYSFKKDGITFVKIARIPLVFPIINGYLFKKQIRKIYEEKNIDIIISQSFTNETEQPLDLPYIYDINDYHYGFAEVYGSWLYKISYKLLGVRKTVDRQIKNAKHVIAVSDYLMKYAKKLNKNTTKITNGVDQVFLKEKNKPEENINKHSLIYVGNFGKWSMLEEIVLAIKNLKDEYPNILLTIVGDGPALKQAKEDVINFGLSKQIKFTGWIKDRKKILELIKSSEICINISEENVFRIAASPIKFFEYAALGKKIISTKLPEITKLNYPYAFYLDGSTVNNLAETIKTAMNIKLPENNKWLRRNEFSWINLSKQLVNIIERTKS
jgi:glycosyltransferase involved in cell wall biosynthesis